MTISNSIHNRSDGVSGFLFTVVVLFDDTVKKLDGRILGTEN